MSKDTVDAMEIRTHNKGFTARIWIKEFLWISTGNGLLLGEVNPEHLMPTIFTDEFHTLDQFIEKQAVYARTVGHLYRLRGFRTLVQLLEETDAEHFLRISRSMLVDPLRVGGRRPDSLELGIELEAPLRKLEWIHTSDDGFQRYLGWLKQESDDDSTPAAPEARTVRPAPVRPVRREYPEYPPDETRTGPGPGEDPSPIHVRGRSGY